MEGCTRHGNLHNSGAGRSRSWLWRLFCLALALGLLSAAPGCSRRFYRNQADKEAAEVIGEKDQVPAWKLEQYHVYPDPHARFADPTNPDRPPMPPDDPAAHDLSPNPQKPKHVGVAKVEGTGYLELLAAWDKENRAALAQALANDPTARAESAARESPPYGGPPPKDGQPKEGQPGATAEENPQGCRPYLITLEQASELGLINSREFQDRREELYLTALPVTVERFAFAAQFFAMEEIIRERTGRQTAEGAHNRWQLNTTAGLTKLFPTGALLLFRFANQTLLEMTGQQKHTVSTSTINLDLVQPLLRGGGRAVTLEPLTQVERNLLYDLRDYARFRKQFYVRIAAGPDATIIIIPTAFGGASVALAAISGNQVQIAPGTAGRGATTTTAAGIRAPTEGYLPNVLRAAVLANERKNVASLESFLRRFRDLAEGPDISQLQVEQVEQQLLQGRSTVLQRQLDYRDGMDNFKLQLGLPPCLSLELDPSPLRDLNRHLQRFEQVIQEFEAARTAADAYAAPDEAGQLRERFRKLFQTAAIVKGTRFPQTLPPRWARWEQLPSREQMQLGILLGTGPAGLLPALPGLVLDPEDPVFVFLRQLGAERRRLLDRKADLEKDGGALSEEEQRRLDQVEREIDLGRFELALRRYERRPWQDDPNPVRRLRTHDAYFRDVVNQFALVLEEARAERFVQLRQAWPKLPALCLDGANLLDADLGQAEAAVAQAALINRFDLMNARAELVDAWRKIAVLANALLGTFNVTYHLDSATPPMEAKPFAFSGSRTRHQLILNLEAPLVRVVERNNYRAGLIAYQRQRRALMSFEDQVMADVRSEIRQLQVAAENYKIQQQQVELAYSQVENSLEVLNQPPSAPAAGQVGQVTGGAGAGNAAALTLQLLNAQASLIRAQNQLYTVWISYVTTRLQLYRDLELMPLDSRGVWIDDLSRQDCTRSCPAGPGAGHPGLRLDDDGPDLPGAAGSGPGDAGPGERAPRPTTLPPAAGQVPPPAADRGAGAGAADGGGGGVVPVPRVSLEPN
jgi:Outer membrane efflux protein